MFNNIQTYLHITDTTITLNDSIKIKMYNDTSMNSLLDKLKTFYKKDDV